MSRTTRSMKWGVAVAALSVAGCSLVFDTVATENSSVESDATVLGECFGRDNFGFGEFPADATLQAGEGGECFTEENPGESRCGDYNLACTIDQDTPTNHARLFFPVEDTRAIEVSFYLMLEDSPSGHLTFARVLSADGSVAEARARQDNLLGVRIESTGNEKFAEEPVAIGEWIELRLQVGSARLGGARLLQGDQVIASIVPVDTGTASIVGVELGAAEISPDTEAAHMHLDGIRLRSFNVADLTN